MKAFFIFLLSFMINYQLNASAAECPLSTLSDDQKNVVLYLCWKPMLKEKAKSIDSIMSRLESAMRSDWYSITPPLDSAPIPNLLLNGRPIRWPKKTMDAETKMVTVSGFSSLDTPFDEFLPAVLRGKELFASQGYDIFAGSCITIEKAASE